MNVRFVTQQIHAMIDYPVALALVALPFVLDLGQSNPLALWLSVGTGIAAFLLTVFTNHETGIVRVLPYSFHLAADFAVGVVFAIAPIVFGFTGIDAWFYWANSLAVLTVVSLHSPSPQHTTLAGQAA